jgi:hypothetical protein
MGHLIRCSRSFSRLIYRGSGTQVTQQCQLLCQQQYCIHLSRACPRLISHDHKPTGAPSYYEWHWARLFSARDQKLPSRCAATAQPVASKFRFSLSEDGRGLQRTYIYIRTLHLRCAHLSAGCAGHDAGWEPKSLFLSYATRGVKHTTLTWSDATGLATYMGGGRVDVCANIK